MSDLSYMDTNLKVIRARIEAARRDERVMPPMVT